MSAMWPTPKGTDGDRGGRGDPIQAVRGNVSPSGHFSPVSEGSTSGSSGPVCELCGSASRTSSAEPSLPNTGQGFRVTGMCAPLWPSPTAGDAKSSRNSTARRHKIPPTGIHAGNTLTDAMTLVQGDWCPCRCHTLTSSAVASPARTFHSPAVGQGSADHVRVFGGSSQGSLGNYDPATSSLRTSQLSLLEGSTSCLAILPRAGSMRSGTIFQRRPLAPLTGGTGSGSLPTPKSSPSGPDFARANREGSGGDDLATFVAREQIGLTKDGLWTTPCADDTGARKDKYPQGGTALSTQAGGSLNPTWVEWLMGYPTGWTDLEPSGTALSPRLRSGSEPEFSSGKKKD